MYRSVCTFLLCEKKPLLHAMDVEIREVIFNLISTSDTESHMRITIELLFKT